MSGGAVAGMAVLAGVLHAQVHGGSGEGLGQGQDVGIGAHVLLHRVLQSLLEGGPGLQAHAPGDARLPRAHNVDGAGVLLRQMAAAHHGKTVTTA